MGTDDGTPIFCCIGAARVPPPANHKPHHDPNRELHETIFRSFIAYALRRHQEADRQEELRTQAAQEIFRRLLSLADSGPSTPKSFPTTPLSISPAPFYSIPLRESLESGLAAALQLPPQQEPSVPVLTYEALKNNPLNADTPYVIHLTSRLDFGPVYSHRYFIYPKDFSEDWIEITKPQWFAEGTSFNMKAEKWDLKCTKDCRFFRITLRPNLSMRGRPVPTPARNIPTMPAIRKLSHVTQQTAYSMPSSRMKFLGREFVPMSMRTPALKQISYAQTSYPVENDHTEFQQRQSSMPLLMPASDVKQISYAYPTENGQIEIEERESSIPMSIPTSAVNQVSYAQSRPMPNSGIDFAAREFSAPTFVPTTDVNQISYFHAWPNLGGGINFGQTERSVSNSLSTPDTKQLSYAQIAWSLANSNTDSSVPLLMPTPDVKQVSYLVTDEGTESRLVGGAK